MGNFMYFVEKLKCWHINEVSAKGAVLVVVLFGFQVTFT